MNKCPKCGDDFAGLGLLDIRLHLDRCTTSHGEPTLPTRERDISADLRKMDWFHPIDREQAEKLLSSSTEDCFLVRPSSQSGALALSMYNATTKNIRHCLIESRPYGYAFEVFRD